MVAQLIAIALCNGGLLLFNGGRDEFNHFAALQADEMVVVTSLLELVLRAIRTEMMPNDESCLLELGQNAVDGR